jgi:multidrug efflux system membrane fusion protein
MTQDNPVLKDALHAEVRPPGRSRWRSVVVWLLIAAAVGGSVWLVQARAKRATQQQANAAREASERSSPVLTSEVAQRDVPIWREGLGNVQAFYTVTVKPLVDGRIDQVLYREGQRVKKGDLLLQIDPRPFQIQLLSAQAALERDQSQLSNGQLNLDRYKALSADSLIAKQQLTDQVAMVSQLDAQIKSDQAAIDSAKLNLDYARIRAPIDGVLGVRLVDPGNVVHASDSGGLVVVTQLDPIAVIFTLPEDDLPAISLARAKSSAPLAVDALARDGETLLATGRLLVIDNQINQATATIRLKAIFDNPSHVLWPNAFVKARIHLSTQEKATVIPAAAVQRGPQGTFAYVATPAGTASAQPIDVSLTQGETAVIASGLRPGEQVIVEGQALLRPGAKIAAKLAPPAASSASSSRSAMVPTEAKP